MVGNHERPTRAQIIMVVHSLRCPGDE